MSELVDCELNIPGAETSASPLEDSQNYTPKNGFLEFGSTSIKFYLVALSGERAGEVEEEIKFPWDFQFPTDHGSHSDYRTEWWYLTGVIQDEEGRRLGLQLALMRLGLAAEPPERDSRWGASEIYAGLFFFHSVIDANNQAAGNGSI